MDNHSLKQKRSELQKQLGEMQLKKSVSPTAIKDTSLFHKIRASVAQINRKLSTK